MLPIGKIFNDCDTNSAYRPFHPDVHDAMAVWDN